MGSKKDGRNPKFRILCKLCNSYQHTEAVPHMGGIHVVCRNCGNSADSFEEEFDKEEAE